MEERGEKNELIIVKKFLTINLQFFFHPILFDIAPKSTVVGAEIFIDSVLPKGGGGGKEFSYRNKQHINFKEPKIE